MSLKRLLVLFVAIAGLLAVGATVASAQPSNDNFANATTISGASGSTAGTNVDATAEANEPSDLSGVSVWYTWTPSTSGTVEFCTPADYDTMMGVYTGSSVDALTEAVFDDDIGLPPDPGYGSGVRFDATASTTYYIGVGGFSGATGNFTLKWGRCIPPQVFFASTKATVVKGPNVTVSFGARDGWDSSSLPNATWCDLDNTGWVACTSPYTNALPAGTHTLEIKAIENGVDSTDRASEAGGLLSTTFTIHSHKIKP